MTPLCFPLLSFAWGWTLASKWGLRRNSALSSLPDLGFSIILCPILPATLQKHSQIGPPGDGIQAAHAPTLTHSFGRRVLGFEKLALQAPPSRPVPFL